MQTSQLTNQTLQIELKLLWRRESKLRTWADMERKEGFWDDYAHTTWQINRTHDRIDEINQLLKERDN